MTAKIAISLPDDLLVAVRAAVARGEAASVSAYIAAALRQRVGTPLLELLEEWYAEDGRPSAEDYAWARKALGLTDA